MAPIIKIAALLNLSLYVVAQGTQFITGPCQSDADCASGCCGFNSGKCAGPVIAQERDGGCGFGDTQPNDRAAQALTGGAGNANGNANAAPSTTAAAPAAAGTSAAKAPGTQFITGECTSDADCASACCGFTSGKCAAPLVAKERGENCGFGDAQSNLNALGEGAATGAANGNGNGNGNANGNGNGDGNSNGNGNGNANGNGNGNGNANGNGNGNGNANGNGNGNANGNANNAQAPGTQFITGPCTSDADCALGCCGFNTGKCAGPVVAQERDGGCGFGDAQPNDNAAQALQGRSLGRRGAALM